MKWRRRCEDAKLAILEAQDQQDLAHRQTPQVNRVARHAQEQVRRAMEIVEGAREELPTRVRHAMTRRRSA